MAEKKENLNAGHRSRMRNRYLASGLDGFQPHEVLEMLLFYALPRRDTNKIAHELINRFHSLAGVLDADIKDLQDVDGIAEGAAVFLKMLPDVFKAYEMSKISSRITINHSRELRKFMKSLYVNEVCEKAYVICLDSMGRIICAEPVAKGTSRNVVFDIRSVVEIALRNHCDTIMLIHNHPDGNEMPSDSDIYATKALHSALSAIGITLSDHYIKGSCLFSMKQACMF